jgi:hypothetical protein
MQPYFRTTSFSTAACGLLTILHHFNPRIAPSRENEFKIWHSTVNLPTRGSSIYALASCAKKHGLTPKVIVEEKEYSFPDYRFYRYTKEDVEAAGYSESQYLQKAKSLGVEIQENAVSVKDIKEMVQQGHVLLLRLNVKGIRRTKRNTSNYVVVHGYASGYFHIIDPAFAALSIPEEVLNEAFESLETKKHRDRRMIVFGKNAIQHG